MKMFMDLTSSKVCVRIARFVVVVLLFLSSRTSVFSPVTLVYNGKRPRPSRQALPSQPVRPATAQNADGGRDGDPPRFIVGLHPSSGGSPVFSCASHQHLRTETTKPAYLQFFDATGVPNHLSPPA
jgi:hypothetical protein